MKQMPMNTRAMPRGRNWVRDIILKKFEEIRVGQDDPRGVSNLEALVDVIFERAIETRGRVPIEAARLLFEYAVGKPKQSLEIEDGRDVVEKNMSREEILQAMRDLAIDAEVTIEGVNDVGPEGKGISEGDHAGRKLLEAGGKADGDKGAEKARVEVGAEGRKKAPKEDKLAVYRAIAEEEDPF